jgi:hypothetical protein
MTNDPSDSQRRTLLQLAAGMAALGQCEMNVAGAARGTRAATGAPGDFDFLSGNWEIQHRRWRDGSWDRFDGQATVVGLLGGAASVEELRIPSRNITGMGLRLLDVKRKLWADYWANANNGLLGAPSWGGFTQGVGTWDAPDVDGAQPIIVRGVWDRITPHSCRWHQAVSRDAGRSWDENWAMDWRRVPA